MRTPLNPQILRDYIKSALYDPALGYFTNPATVQLGSLPSPIKFSSLLGYSDYTEQLNLKYPKHKFLTPSEIFRPYYGMSMAAYVRARQLRSGAERIRVVEIGSGLGGQADSFLTYFKNYEPELYNCVEYTLLEISESLLKKSRSLVYQNHRDKCNRGEVRFVNQDAFGFRGDLGDDVFFVMFEILDNLPHDMVRFDKGLGNVEEMWVNSSPDWKHREIEFRSCEDEYIVKCFDIWKSLYTKNGKIQLKETETPQNALLRFIDSIRRKTATGYQLYLPTGFLKLTEHITRNFNNPKFLLSDFSSLPNSTRFADRRICLNHPLLSTKLEKSEEHLDYDSIETAEFGKCDIFFETDFELAGRILENFGGRYRVSKPAEFFGEFGRAKWAETQSGYNPMKEDFLNTRFLHE